MQRIRKRNGMLTLAAVLWVGGCGGDDSGPSPAPPVIAKTTIKSGDGQVGPVNNPLLSLLRIVVTQDGNPAPDVGVKWSTTTGSLTPDTALTGADGVSSSIWTLGGTAGPQTATASVAGATGSPVTFTATATSGSSNGPTIAVLGPAGGNRFDPVDVTIIVGQTVTWQWAEDAIGHNVVPDNDVTPVTSGSLTNGPHTYEFTFTAAGVYRYHCAAHGVKGGGMSGTITVLATQP